MPQYPQATYTDELLADDTVHRRYSDGTEEWRTRGPGGVVVWRDNRGNSGTDELLGNKIIKRTHRVGADRYGRESGYGRTLWSHGMVTVNRSSFGGRLGVILAAATGGVLLGALVPPPDSLSTAQEEELRNQTAQQAQSGSSSSEVGYQDDWDGGYGDDDDFG